MALPATVATACAPCLRSSGSAGRPAAAIRRAPVFRPAPPVVDTAGDAGAATHAAAGVYTAAGDHGGYAAAADVLAATGSPYVGASAGAACERRPSGQR